MPEDEAIIKDIQRKLKDHEKRIAELEDAVFEEEEEGEPD